MDLNTFYYIYITCYYLSVITLIILSISLLDDLFIDITYWVYWLYRKNKMRHYQALTYSKLCSKPEEHLAVLIPCFNDAKIIESMLSHNCMDIDYENYKIFVGVYKNDIETLDILKSFSKLNDRVICVIHEDKEFENKAHNLNQIYKYIIKYEEVNNINFSAFIFHNAEDLIHPVSLKVFNFLISRKDVVQLPEFPLTVLDACFTHWTYNDEVSENNTKDLVVREVLSGFIPSTGSGTSFSRRAIDVLVKENKGCPFDTNVQNEFYSAALILQQKNIHQIFVTKHIFQNQWRRRSSNGKYFLKRLEVYIATSSLYPLKYLDAVKQKSRWILGTALQSAKNLGTPKTIATKYGLLHDKKILLTYFFNVLGCFLFIFWVAYFYLDIKDLRFLNISEIIKNNKVIYGLLVIFSFLIIERLLQRMIAVYRVYDNLISILLSIPRAIYGNIINGHALIRAFIVFLFAKKSQEVAWNKINYDLPNIERIISKKKLIGELLLEKKLLSKKELVNLLQKQQISGQFLGKLAVENKYIDDSQLEDLLSEQFEISKIPYKNLHILDLNDLPISKDNYNWLISNELYPIKIFNNKITIALKDPSNTLLIEDLTKKLKPLHVIIYLVYSH